MKGYKPKYQRFTMADWTVQSVIFCLNTARKLLLLYSARDLIGTPELFAENHEYVLERLSQMGYTGAEAASYADGAGLDLVSAHATRMLSKKELTSGDLTAALEWWDECIEAHKKAGIRFGYHNHAHEFERIGNTTMMDYFITHTEPENVFIEMDVYWAVVGGAAPVEYMRKYPGRFEILHIKDKREVGQSGMVGFDAIFRNFDIAGTKGFVVEMEEASTPNILKGLRESALYLRNNIR